MMLGLPLAEGFDQGNIAKFLIFGVAIIVWLLNALASWVAKQKEEENRRRVREALDKSPKQPPADRRAPVMQRPPMVQRPTAQRPMQPRPGPPKLPPLPSPVVRDNRGKRKQKSAPVAAPTIPEPVVSTVLTPAPPVAPVQAAKSSAATAASIATWMRPATTRQQFILTEVLQPPIALRDSHLDR